MTYKIVPGSKKTRKFVHLLLHLVALAFGGLGLYAALKSHRDVKLADMYSPRSWFGMGTFSLYILRVTHGAISRQKTGAILFFFFGSTIHKPEISASSPESPHKNPAMS